MAVILVVTRQDKSEIVKEVPVDRKLVIGNSVYCDVVLLDKTIANMQCQVQPVKTGHVVMTNLDMKKEVMLNQSRLKKSAIRVDDVVKIGPYILRIDPTKLTPEELIILNSEYEEFV